MTHFRLATGDDSDAIFSICERYLAPTESADRQPGGGFLPVKLDRKRIRAIVMLGLSSVVGVDAQDSSSGSRSVAVKQ
ncbi:hypothetical protein [Pandoraea sputorum]|uniref:hypothetical protein n=1 Tax=Pandoraea sputorum TaxID=93222 RepID=UPI0012580CE5|nr:hypothetical protein [Pandoraea sputorum]VVE55267.1 hypothetical protein PSP20601_04972 [Pandoraea sputorum]